MGRQGSKLMTFKHLIYKILVFFEKDINKIFSLGIILLFIGAAVILDSNSPLLRDTSGDVIQESEYYRVTETKGLETAADYVSKGEVLLKKERSHYMFWGVASVSLGVIILILVFVYFRKKKLKFDKKF